MFLKNWFWFSIKYFWSLLCIIAFLQILFCSRWFFYVFTLKEVSMRFVKNLPIFVSKNLSRWLRVETEMFLPLKQGWFFRKILTFTTKPTTSKRSNHSINFHSKKYFFFISWNKRHNFHNWFQSLMLKNLNKNQYIIERHWVFLYLSVIYTNPYNVKTQFNLF